MWTKRWPHSTLPHSKLPHSTLPQSAVAISTTHTHGRVAQLVRALLLQSRCRGFESLLAHSNSKSAAWRLRRLAPTAEKMSSLRDYTASSDERRLLNICVNLRSSVFMDLRANSCSVSPLNARVWRWSVAKETPSACGDGSEDVVPSGLHSKLRRTSIA